MLKKFYEKVKEFIKTEYKFILFLIVFVVICTWPVNYYIVIGGGISDISDRVVVENGDSSNGSFNLSYVSELKGTTLSYLLSYVMPHWKRVSMDDYKYTTDEDYQDIEFRSELDLLSSNSNAIYYAYQLADKPCEVVKTDVYVIVKFPEYDNPLEVGDKLLKVNGVLCANLVEFQEAIQKVEGNSVHVTVLRDGKEMELTSKLYEEENRKVLGVGLQSFTTYDVDPEVEFQFEKNESGPSAGLITTLSIYDQLTKGDLTKGKLIAGTGTIEADGSIGQIGEVEYKLLGAVDGGAQVFLVPAGENYQDCKKMKKEENLDIKLISVKNIDDAIKKLKDL
ncbi:MAG TPA: hypothetical protein IAD45_02415 [Candidatus Faecimonas intestinavium]|nr:S16 family serine protease [Bacilli bacterium]HIT23251.1 hypothetical protein [Candidatus Faecimonas intestinavium]